jgi:hypothetical protein
MTSRRKLRHHTLTARHKTRYDLCEANRLQISRSKSSRLLLPVTRNARSIDQNLQYNVNGLRQLLMPRHAFALPGHGIEILN